MPETKDTEALKREWLDAKREADRFHGCSSRSKAFQKAMKRERDAGRALLAAGIHGTIELKGE